MTSPSISVLMSAYNAERYLQEAVESILAQTHGDFEFIIVNDGSTDRTTEVLAGFSDSRIRVLEQENTGMMVALNRGLREARAPLIARMDADDVCTRDRLERELAVLNALPEVDIVSARVQHMDAEGRLLDTSYPPRFPDALELVPVEGFVRTYRLRGNVLAALLDASFISHAPILGKRKAFIECGGYDETFHRAEDYDLWLRLVNRGCQFAHIDEPLYFYRMHEAQNTRSDGAILSHHYHMLAIQKLLDSEQTPSETQRLARRALGMLQKDQAYRLKRAGRHVEARRMYRQAVRNCPNAEHWIALILDICGLPNVPVTRVFRRFSRKGAQRTGSKFRGHEVRGE